MLQESAHLSHDFDAAALQNMDQITSRESSATFTDQNNMDPWNDSLTLEYIADMDRALPTPGFTESQNAAPAGRSESQVFLFCYLDIFIDFSIARQFIR